MTGRAPLAHPALMWDFAIGQSTLATRQVRANLFYRGLALLRRLAAALDADVRLTAGHDLGSVGFETHAA